MAKVKVIWSRTAKKKLYSFLESQIGREKSKSSAVQIGKMVFKKVKNLIKNPEAGIITSEKSISGLFTGSLIIYYEVTSDSIIIHTICDWTKHSELPAS